MLYIVFYYLISGAVFYFLIKFINNRSGKEYSSKMPRISGFLHLVLGVFFLAYYYANPQAFSPEAVINNQVLYVLMGIFSAYFYMLAPGISTGNLAILYKQKNKSYINNKEYILISLINLTAVFSFGFLSYQLFG